MSALTPKMQEIFKKIKENLKDERDFDLINLFPEWADLFNYCYLKAEIEEIEEKDIVPEINNCIKEIKFLEIRNKLGEISKEMKKAEEEKNLPETQKLLEKFNSCSKNLSDLEN
jgi:hypothetical protein